MGLSKALTFKSAAKIVLGLSAMFFLHGVYSCTFSFAIILLLFIYIGIGTYYISMPANFKLLICSTTIALLIGEVYLRFILQYPATYTEQNGEVFVSEYYMQQSENLLFKIFPSGKADLHTKEYNPYQEIDISSVENIIRPTERYNELGYRGKLPTKNKKVLACFGDSFTESACVPIDSSYPFLLEKLLRKTDENFEVINMGISGNDPFYDFKTLQKIQTKFRLHTVVFMLNSTDVGNVLYRGGNERFAADGTLNFSPTPFWERLYGLSYLFRLVPHNLLKLDYCYHTPVLHQALQQQAIQKIKKLFEQEIIPFCQAKNIQLIIALHPLVEELTKPEEYKEWTGNLRQIPGAVIADTYYTIQKAHRQNPLYYTVDKHCNGRGYQLFATTVNNALNKQYDITSDKFSVPPQ